MHALERQARHAFRQVFVGSEHAIAQLVGVELQQLVGIDAEIEADDTVAVGRMLGERHDQREAAARRGNLARDMHDRRHLADVQQRRCKLLVAQLQRVFVQARLCGAQPPREGQRGIDIGECVMRLRVLDAVGRTQALKPERCCAVVALRPFQPFGP